MSLTPGPPGEYEVVVHTGHAGVWAARLRAAAHDGRRALGLLRRWFRTPEGRRITAQTVRAVAATAMLVGAIVLVRRWSAAARGAFAAVAAGYRAAAGALGAAVDGARFVLSLGWLSRLLRLSAQSGGPRNHRHCPDCHARIRSDARVCYRCGCRELAPGSRRRRDQLRGLARVLSLRVYRRCPDCRRYMHADARVCRSCGYRLRG